MGEIARACVSARSASERAPRNPSSFMVTRARPARHLACSHVTPSDGHGRGKMKSAIAYRHGGDKHGEALDAPGGPTATAPEDTAFCIAILPRVSRTFALSIEALPEPLRAAVRTAYLLCRVVDSIEDEASLPAAQRN